MRVGSGVRGTTSYFTQDFVIFMTIITQFLIGGVNRESSGGEIQEINGFHVFMKCLNILMGVGTVFAQLFHFVDQKLFVKYKYNIVIINVEKFQLSRYL
jgi:hypothetical protein